MATIIGGLYAYKTGLFEFENEEYARLSLPETVYYNFHIKRNLPKIYQTVITDWSMEIFKQLPGFSKLYVLDTNISKTVLEALEK